MTSNDRPGAPVVVSWERRLDLFARAPDDSLLHVWTTLPLVEGAAATESEVLPGDLAGDPCAVSAAGNRLDVFARGVGGRLLHWSYDEGEGAMTGPVGGPDLRIAYDPTAVVLPGGAIALYARSATDDLLVWNSPDGDSWTGPTPLGGGVADKPAAVYRPGSSGPDVFVRATDGALRHFGRVHVIGSGDDRDGWEDLEFGLTGPPAVLSWSPDRLDVLAPTSPGGLLHWGWAGRQRYYDSTGVWHTGRWYGGGEDRLDGAFAGPAVLVSPKPNLAEAYARGPDGELAAWLWDGIHGIFSPYNFWTGPIRVGGPISRAPAALVLDGRAHVFAWDDTGARLLVFRHDEAAWTSWQLTFPWPAAAVPQAPMAKAAEPADYLLHRPADLAVLGVSWQGYRVTDDPPVLAREGAGPARLVLAFPPQHIGEEVSAGPGPWDPPIGEFTIAPFGSWHSVLAGPSQLVLEPVADRIPLTAEGILAATRGARILPHSPGDPPPRTTIELPWQLLIAPAGDAVSEHPVLAVPGADEAVGLWRARLRSTRDELDVVGSGGRDAFPMALGNGLRRLVAAQAGPAHLDRLELTALGGSLSATGTWASVSWQQDVSLGRDQRVQVQVSGVLYPFGHRAEYVQWTERFPAEPDTEPIAMLRTRRTLTVTEPVRTGPDAPELARAFPFDSVELLTRQFADIDEPWPDGGAPGDDERFLRQPLPPQDAVDALALLHERLAGLPEMPGDWAGGPPVMERVVLAAQQDPDSELAADQSRIAEEYLALVESVQRTEEEIAALIEAGVAPLPWFFCPRRQGAWVTTTAQLRTGGSTLDCEFPMLFVVDQQLPRTAVMTAFDSLRDGDITRRLTEKWAAIRRQLGTDDPAAPGPDGQYAGVTGFAATRLDLIRSGRSGDIQVANRFNVTGVRRDREFFPRLGPDGPGDPGPRWGVQVELPALRSLLPGRPEAHQALVRFTDEYQLRGPVEDVALAMVDDGAVPVDFTADADRSGGLVSPKLAVDAISRDTGLVNLAGLRSLRAEDYFDAGATLLGFPLTSLVSTLPSPPAITTDLSGPQPAVKLTWDRLELVPRSPFGAVDDPPTPQTPAPTLTLTVDVCGPSTSTLCTLSDFALSFPASSPLLTLTFRSLSYRQEAARPPTLQVDGLHAEFSGALDVLRSLQDKVGLDGSEPAVRVSEQGIVAAYSLPVPEASAGAFVMRNLAFRAAVDVPFDGRPVSVSVGFASRADPFNLSVLALGGGGYIDIELDRDGLRRMEVCLEFGASVAVDFVVASGEAHVLGGIRFELLPDKSVQLTGYLRIGGSLEVLGLVSVSVELVLSLGYQSNGNRLVGRATLVLEIDLTLFSDSVELDSGEWTIAGGESASPGPGGSPGPLPVAGPVAPPDADQDPFLAAWQAHRRAFDPQA